MYNFTSHSFLPAEKYRTYKHVYVDNTVTYYYRLLYLTLRIQNYIQNVWYAVINLRTKLSRLLATSSMLRIIQFIYCLLDHLFDSHTYKRHKLKSNRSWAVWRAIFTLGSERWHIFLTNSTMSIPLRFLVTYWSPFWQNHRLRLARARIAGIWPARPMLNVIIHLWWNTAISNRYKFAENLISCKFLYAERVAIYTLYLNILIFLSTGSLLIYFINSNIYNQQWFVRNDRIN